MGAMMWFMMRGNKSQHQSGRETPPPDMGRHASLELLREEHDRLGAEIDRLEHGQVESPETSAQR
jgi:hypothetical protein